MAQPLRDVDSVTRARRIQAFGWGAFPGIFIGTAAAVPLSEVIGGVAFVVLPVLFTAVVGGVALAVGEGVGGLVAAMAHPRGAPVAPDYSRADALRLRGDLDGAVAALRAKAELHPGDPEPPLRLARIFRDDLDRPDEAVTWFQIARDAPRLTPTGSSNVSRELAELLRKQDHLPAALTELARLAALHPETPAGRWAEAERDHVKALWAARPDA